MNLKLYILLISLILAASCSPQIRFATKSAKSTANNVKSGLGNSKERNLIDKALKDINKTAKELRTDLSVDAHLSQKRKEIVSFALSYLGTPYCYGGQDKECTDCSGFVVQVFDMAGLKIPRTSALQYKFGVEISDFDMLPGDLVFFIRESKIGHVGIYVGNYQFIHASTSKGVILQNLDDEYYRTTFAGFRRILETV